MSFSSREDKTRAIINLVERFGEKIKSNPATQERIYNLPGAARVEVSQQGLRLSFKILASGAEIHAGSWRGQMEPARIVRGDEGAIERIFSNAARIGARIKAQREAAEAERLRLLTACVRNRFTGRAF